MLGRLNVPGRVQSTAKFNGKVGGRAPRKCMIQCRFLCAILATDSFIAVGEAPGKHAVVDGGPVCSGVLARKRANPFPRGTVDRDSDHKGHPGSCPRDRRHMSCWCRRCARGIRTPDPIRMIAAIQIACRFGDHLGRIERQLATTLRMQPGGHDDIPPNLHETRTC
jgi:hypothetical protein